MVSEANRNRFIVIAAVCFWLAAALNAIELVVEGSTILNWVTTVSFIVLGVYYTLLSTRAR